MNANDMLTELRSKSDEIRKLCSKAVSCTEPKRKAELLVQYHRLQSEWTELYRDIKQANRHTMAAIWDRLQHQ